MIDRDRATPTEGTEDSDGADGDPGPGREARNRTHAEPRANTRDRTPKPMTDDSNPTEGTNRAATKSNRTTSDANRPRRRVKDVDHTSPVDGHARTFERNNEGRRPKTDGGRRRETDGGAADDEGTADGAQPEADAEASSDGDERRPTGDERVRRRVKDRDHTSPVDGHKRTFMRGDEDADDAK